MSRRWPVDATRRPTRDRHDEPMQARYVRGVTIRPLRHGDTATVEALFARLGSTSRQRRFCGAKPRLTDDELATLARVDETHHVLVAYVDGGSTPAGIARIVRDGGDGRDRVRGRGRAPGTRHRLGARAGARCGRARGRHHAARRDGLRRQPAGRIPPAACRALARRPLARRRARVRALARRAVAVRLVARRAARTIRATQTARARRHRRTEARHDHDLGRPPERRGRRLGPWHPGTGVRRRRTMSTPPPARPSTA